MDIKAVNWQDVDWIDLAQDRDKCAGFCEPGDEISGSVK
jgi:hypothetical protein